MLQAPVQRYLQAAVFASIHRREIAERAVIRGRRDSGNAVRQIHRFIEELTQTPIGAIGHVQLERPRQRPLHTEHPLNAVRVRILGIDRHGAGKSAAQDSGGLQLRNLGGINGGLDGVSQSRGLHLRLVQVHAEGERWVHTVQTDGTAEEIVPSLRMPKPARTTVFVERL